MGLSTVGIHLRRDKSSVNRKISLKIVEPTDASFCVRLQKNAWIYIQHLILLFLSSLNYIIIP